MDYGRAIRVCRTAYGLTQAQLADRLTIGTSQLSLIELGKRQPSVRVLREVSSALGVPPHLLALLASEPEDLQETNDEEATADLAKALLRFLRSAGRQPSLPLNSKRSA
jgi:transcriptional regulator with XRE-family HTH domain